MAYYDNELEKAENRPSNDSFLSGDCDNTKHLYGINGAGVTHDYVGFVKGYDATRSIALVEVKNIFAANDLLEVFGPTTDIKQFVCKLMFDEKWNCVTLANKPTQLLMTRVPFKLHKNDMIRKVNK